MHRPSRRRPARTAALSVPLLLAAVLALPGPARAQDGPRWPLDLSERYLTSNFMEYRPGRFHAGLDLKTRTVTGFPAYAVEDGWIVRVRATPTAYGRSVYLRGASGRTYVYAHLDRFSDRLRSLVEARRATTGRYRVRLEFGPDEIPVRRGDVLGLTGQSGTGGPHLHFEVRDAANRPVDPQAEGFAVPDTIAPRITVLRAWPVTPEARLQAGRGEHVLTDPDGLRGELPALRVTGPVAFSARIVEVADIRGHRLEPAEITVTLDGRPAHACRNEGYDFGENALQRLEWVEVPGVRERWLHRHPANTLAGREGDAWYLGPDGAGLPPGRHRVEVRAADAAGNAAVVGFDLVVDGGPHGEWALESRAWRSDPVSPVLATPDSGAVITVSPFFDTPDPVVFAAWPGLRRLVFDPAAGDPVQARLVVYARPARLDSVQRRAAADQGLAGAGAGCEFTAAGWPIEASLPVEMAVPGGAVDAADDGAWGLFRWDGREWDRVEAWSPAGGAAGRTTVHIGRPGLHALLRDASPPRFGLPVGPVTVAPGPASTVPGVTLPRWEVLPVPVTDTGAGLDLATLAVRLDGAPLIVEPDPPRDRLLVAFPDDLAPGRHRLEFAVADRAGHRAEAALEVDLAE